MPVAYNCINDERAVKPNQAGNLGRIKAFGTQRLYGNMAAPTRKADVLVVLGINEGISYIRNRLGLQVARTPSVCDRLTGRCHPPKPYRI